MSHLSATASVSARRRPARIAATARRVRVVVDWSRPGVVGPAEAESSRVELETSVDAGAHCRWTPSDRRREHWEDVLSASRSAEVVLTSHIRGNVAAKDLVLELAEYLTQKLAKTQSLIVVRFLPEGSRHV